MSDHREVTKQHYDLHVRENLPTSLALKARKQGPAAPLKQFHNEIKRQLIYRFAYRAEALLDCACGRGGDLHKWDSAQVRYVKGLDLSPKEIEEAERRYAELQQKPGTTLHAEFQQIDTLGVEVLREEQQYDVITCMFALHYFFDKEESLNTLMQTIALNLKPGGYFIGCVPDGKRIKAHLQKSEGELKLPHLVLKQVSQDTKSPFGCAYIMEIPDTVVEGHEGITEGSHEYLVFEKVLLGQARAHGLQPVVDFGDPNMDALFDPTDADKAMKHFHPGYPEGTDVSLALASKLYMAFVLQKVDKPDQVSTPPVPPPPARGRGRQQQQRGRERSPRPQWPPPRADTFAGMGNGQQPAAQQDQQQQRFGNNYHQGGGRNNRMSSLDWQLPYPPTILQPNDMPCVYYNVKRPDYLQQREQNKGRFTIRPPDLPFQPGPIAYDAAMHPIFQTLPNGQEVYNYYDELNYHAQLQQQQAGLPPPPQQQQQQQHRGGGAGTQPNSSKQQQAQGSLPSFPPPPPSEQEHPPDSSAAASRGGSSAGRGRGRRKAGSAAGGLDADDSGAADVAGSSRGRGRGRMAGSKRDREEQDYQPDMSQGAAAAAAAGEGYQAEGEAADRAPSDKKQATAAAVAAATGGAAAPAAAASGSIRLMPKLGPRAIQNDPLGYKEKQAPVELSQELVDSLMQQAMQYVDS